VLLRGRRFALKKEPGTQLKTIESGGVSIDFVTACYRYRPSSISTSSEAVTGHGKMLSGRLFRTLGRGTEGLVFWRFAHGGFYEWEAVFFLLGLLLPSNLRMPGPPSDFNFSGAPENYPTIRSGTAGDGSEPFFPAGGCL